MAKKVHVVPHKDGWALKVEGNKKASNITNTKKEAQQKGIEKAKQLKTDLVIHGKDGKIQDADSYGNDPNPPEDTKH
jgi:hypothetical protein